MKQRRIAGQMTLGFDEDAVAVAVALEHELRRQRPSARLVREFATHNGDYRIDLAVVDEHLHGWEVKTRRDSLRRLPAQVSAFSEVFESATLVAATRHVSRGSTLIPEWWGLIEIRPDRLVHLRPSGRNPNPSARSRARLLWRDEAKGILEAMNVAPGGRRRADYVAALCSVADAKTLGAAVASVLRERSWRAVD